VAFLPVVSRGGVSAHVLNAWHVCPSFQVWHVCPWF
jgi:hypothetical protein